MKTAKPEPLGAWTALKQRIIRDFAREYATVKARQPLLKSLAYIDAGLDAGLRLSTKATETGSGPVLGAITALGLAPAFTHHYWIDRDARRAARLVRLAEGHAGVQVFAGEVNEILLLEVLPCCRFEDYCRGLCLIDPYELEPSWKVVAAAARVKGVELFSCLPVLEGDTPLWRAGLSLPAARCERLNACWGDQSWRVPAAAPPAAEAPERALAKAYQERLRSVAGFPFVPEPLALRNARGAVTHYLCFASHNRTGAKIAGHIFAQQRRAS